jgi:hypothetical protein
VTTGIGVCSSRASVQQEVRREAEKQNLLISWPPLNVAADRTRGQEVRREAEKQNLLISWPPVNVASD